MFSNLLKENTPDPKPKQVLFRFDLPCTAGKKCCKKYKKGKRCEDCPKKKQHR